MTVMTLVLIAATALTSIYLWRRRVRYLGESRLKLHEVGETVVSNGKRFVVTAIRYEPGVRSSVLKLGESPRFERYLFFGRPAPSA